MFTAFVIMLRRIRIPYRLGLIIRIGPDRPKPYYWHATMNPDYTAWGYITQIYSRYFVLYTYWMKVYYPSWK